MKRVIVGLLAVMALLGGVFSAGPPSSGVQAATPGTTVKPILSCPDVDGIAPVGLFYDILPVADFYGADSNDTGGGEPDGYHPLYDVKDANGTIDLFNDIFYVADNFGVNCPTVDLQVAKATLWGIANLPKTNNPAGVLALQAMGYYRGSSDVPGQGIHYTKLENWDGTFDPQAPEGIVYNNGKLAAQLYVVDGDNPSITWGTYAASSFPPPVTPHDVDLEGDAAGPECSPACSWAAGEGWHMHYYLCTFDIGTATAVARPGDFLFPGVDNAYPIDLHNAGECAAASGGDPVCTVPITTTPCYRWGQNVGWMGHLWNHELNPNQVPDVGGNNGRFADCLPDGSTWKAFTCPS